ncbi:efflux RND transporter permease subunit [Planctomycetota bacterium]
MNITKTSVSRPVLITMIMAGLAGIGLFCYFQLPRELFPEVDLPMVTVYTLYPGAGPEEVQQLISKELEDEISTVEGIKYLRSTSQQGLSLIMAEFYLGTDVDVATADVRSKVNIVRNQLPEEAEDPITMKFDFNALPIMQLAVSAPRSLREVYETADERIKDRLSTVPDVASVEIVGGQEREIHILTDAQRLRACGLNISDIAAAIAMTNLETPGGHISQDAHEYNIRLRGKFTDLDEIRNMRVMLPTGKSVYLREVAEVRDAFKEIREKARADGKVCVGVNVQKRADGNTVAVDTIVQEQIAQLLEVLPDDYEISVQEEQASWILSSINNVYTNMFFGIILTAAALFLFLHSFRAMTIIILTMPLSVVTTFIIIYLMDININMMSMMGLAMTIGVLVNNAILVLENITRYLHLDHAPELAAVEGTNEIAITIASTTLTNVVVFVPIAFMGGIIGQFFKDFGITATVATMVSLFISFTLAPMMASRLLNKQNTSVEGKSLRHRFGRRFDKGLDNLRESYGRALRFCLRHRVLLVFISIVVLVLSLRLAGFIGSEFITSMDQGKFAITIEMPVGTRLEETDAAAAEVEEVLSDRNNLPELVGLYTTIGSLSGGEVGGASQAINIAEVNVTLVKKTERQESTKEIMDRLRPVLARTVIPGARIKLMEKGAGGPGGAPIQMEITGDDLERISEFAQKALAIISDSERVSGAIDVDSNYRLGQPEIRIVPDREKCRANNVDTQYLSGVILTTFEGLILSEYREGIFNYDIRVKSNLDSRKDLKDLEALTVINRSGSLIPLPELAEIQFTTGAAQLFRKNRQNLITVSCDVSGRSMGEVKNDVEEQMQPLLAEYPDCHMFFGGEIELMEESFGRLIVALIMAVCLTYALLASLLESFTQPLVIMISLPLSLIGVFLALFLMDGTFSIFSVMSIIMLVGLVINNSIIVIDYINILRRQGKERTEAIVESGMTRLRPILMANLTTVVAMTPLALGYGFGGELRAPMAMVQIGGLIAGGGLGLFIVPVIFTISDDFNNFVIRLLRGKPRPTSQEEKEM